MWRSEPIGIERMRRILIWRQGSLGDTIVALPAFHVISRRFPRAERWLLTDSPIDGRVAPAASIIADAGLIHGILSYPAQTRRLRDLTRVRRDVARLRPKCAVYLVQARSLAQRIRDRAFLLTCGVGRVVGWSIGSDLSRNLPEPNSDRVETEASRLARAVAPLGDAQIHERENWSIALQDRERSSARQALKPLAGADSIVAFSVGTKWQPNDYGDDNWRTVLATIAASRPSAGLAALGVRSESARTDSLIAAWPGPKINLCGALNVRESAAALELASVFVGHDSGPMHLASAAGIPCIAVFSGRNPPGMWYPTGADHHVFYNAVSCAPCGLEMCHVEGKRCIYSINPCAVGQACLAVLARRSASLPLAV